MNAPVANLPDEVAPRRNEAMAVYDPVPVLDTARFEHMQRIAKVMAASSLVPESLRTYGNSKDKKDLPYEVVFANCFLIVNQAVRWGMDPFAVIQCASIVKGKPCFEGKLVAAVLETKLGVELQYEWSDKTGDAYGITVYAVGAHGEILRTAKGKIKEVSGTVGEWKTTGDNSPWGPPGRRKNMLAYRGAREWARLYQPGVMLGVYSEDELADLADNARASRANNVNYPSPPAPPAHLNRPSPPVVEDAEERPRPPAPPKPSSPAEAVADPEATRKKFEAAAKSAKDIEALQESWEMIVEAADQAGDLLPPDKEDLLGIYRRRERELEP